ncbi:hypothetical protein GCM10008920_01880 [Pediococcus acidilactici]|nr:hypothetical protein GCM10008920_01880 [Pediococcus acidilactici]
MAMAVQTKARYIAGPLFFKTIPNGKTNSLTDLLTLSRCCTSMNSTGRVTAEEVVVNATSSMRVSPLNNLASEICVRKMVSNVKNTKNTTTPLPYKNKK